MDGQYASITENDYARRNTIAKLLQEWGLVKILNPEICQEPITTTSQIKIVPFKEKGNWNLVAKYNIGVKK